MKAFIATVYVSQVLAFLGNNFFYMILPQITTVSQSRMPEEFDQVAVKKILLAR